MSGGAGHRYLPQSKDKQTNEHLTKDHTAEGQPTCDNQPQFDNPVNPVTSKFLTSSSSPNKSDFSFPLSNSRFNWLIKSASKIQCMRSVVFTTGNAFSYQTSKKKRKKLFGDDDNTNRIGFIQLPRKGKMRITSPLSGIAHNVSSQREVSQRASIKG